MDTHISSYPDLEPDPAGISAARLPGEAHDVPASSADLDVGERLPSSAPKPARRRRGVLLAGVAIVAVLAAGGAFLVSPYNTVYPLPHLQASVNRATSNATHYAGSALRPVLAPSASLAKVAVPTVPPPVRDAYTPKPRDQEVAELLSLHPGLSSHGDAGARPAVSTGHPAQEPVDHLTAAAVPPAAVTAAVSDPPNDYVAREPGSIHGSAPAATPVPAPVASPAAPMPKDATALVIASLPQARPATPDALPAPPVSLAPMPAAAPQVADAAAAEAAPPPSPPTPRREALTDAANLRAGPMLPPEQVQVLNLVTEMAAMVKDLRKQQAQLRADLGRSSTDTSARLTDFERRLAFAEARNAVTAADTATDDASPRSAIPANETSASLLKPTPVNLNRPVAVVPSPLVASAPDAGECKQHPRCNAAEHRHQCRHPIPILF